MKQAILFVILSLSLKSFAQIKINTDSEISTNFIYACKTIDEFIERFNWDQTTILNIEKKIGKFDKNIFQGRVDFLKKIVFDEVYKNIKTDLVSDFLNQIEKNPENNLISFYDSKWYVKTKFRVKVNNQEKLLTLTFKNEAQEKGSKWVIVGIGDEIKSFKLLKESYNTKYIPPTNNEVDFLFVPSLLNSNNIKEVISKELLKNKLFTLNEAIKEQKIEFLNCVDKEYYFLQLKIWIIKVSEVNDKKQAVNGFKITELITVNKNTVKRKFENENLFIEE